MRRWPLHKRKTWPTENAQSRPGVHLIDSIDVLGEALYERAIDQDLEGIVAKRQDSPYLARGQLS